MNQSAVWRPVIHLNLVRSINFILNFLAANSSDKGFSGDLRRLRISLAPLREVEASLTAGISGAGPTTDAPTYNPAKASEVAIFSTTGWKGFLASKSRRKSGEVGVKSWERDDDANRRTMAACADDMMKLRDDKAVQETLEGAGIILREQSGL